MTQVSYPCTQCGAKLEYVPGTIALTCPYCGHAVSIEETTAPIQELDYMAYLSAATDESAVETAIVVCQACGAQTRFAESVTADLCPFCGSSLISTASRRLIQPKSLLPFVVTRQQALSVFKNWVKSRWFAPNALKQYAYTDNQRLQGVYLPYWTYDAHTTSYYTGERGEHYWDTETYTTTENGQRVTKTRRVRKTHWYHAAGTVQNTFDDLLVPASHTLEPKFANALDPWKLQQLTPYTEEYLSGFRAESYQVDLEQGFVIAQTMMESPIRSSIRRDIGGDDQRIHSVNTSYFNITFRHLLLPVWLCSYRYRHKIYRFMVNGQTGEVTGERPWSWVKITLLVLAILLVVGMIWYAIRMYGSGYSQTYPTG